MIRIPPRVDMLFASAVWRRTVFAAQIAPLLIIAVVTGCSEATDVSGGRSPRETKSVGTDTPGRGVTDRQGGQKRRLPEGEIWEVICLQGNRVGYGRTTIGRDTLDGRQVDRIEATSRMDFRRSGEAAQVSVEVVNIETPEGRLLDFHAKQRMSKVPHETTGRVVDDSLALKVSSGGKETRASIPWSPDYGSHFASQCTLLRQPMAPGEQRSFRAFDIGVNDLTHWTLTAKAHEMTEMLDGSRRNLLRIDTEQRYSNGKKTQGAYWCDSQGQTLKTWVDMMDLETFRVPKDVALAKVDSGTLDLGLSFLVPISRPLERPHQTHRIRYRVTLDKGNPAEEFAAGRTQQVTSIDERTADITVVAVRPDDPPGDALATTQPPTDEDRRANNLIQSEDPRIMAMARRAAGNSNDPWTAVKSIERYVNGLIVEKGYSKALASAAEVAENPVGDCTEHAVLLAALARARGIPARVAIGLVYIEGQQAFGFHMWNEVYINDRWVPVDATLGRGGIGAVHLKLNHSSLASISAFSDFLPVARVGGGLRISVEEVE